MKREILFRGYSEALNRWVEGLLNQYQSKIYITQEKIEQPTLGDPGGTWIYNEYEVHPESVGQFTGLLDCNGVKVFEGMLIETPKGIAPVTFELGCFYVITVSRYRLGGWATDSIKITGNTFKPQ
jgi:hypothetical protein